MQELLKQQQDEVAACRAALAEQQANPPPGGMERASQGEGDIVGARYTLHRRGRAGLRYSIQHDNMIA